MLKRVAKFLREDFTKVVLTISSGAFLGQLIAVLSAPVILRIYGPSDYGVLGIHILVASLVGSFATMQYGHIIITSPCEKEALQGLTICMALPIPFASLIVLSTPLTGNWFNDWFNHRNAVDWVSLTSISVIAGSTSTSLMYLANRQAKYALLTSTRLLSGILTVTTSITIGLIWPGPIGLVIGYQIGILSSSLILFYTLIWKPGVRLRYSFKELIALAIKFKNLPLFTAPTELLNSFANQLPAVMLGRLGVAAIGSYNASTRVLGIPLTVVSSAIGEAFRQRASVEYNKNGNCKSLFLRTFVMAGFIALPIFAITGLFSPFFFVFLFGDKWQDAGYVAQILSPLFFARFVVSPLTYMFIIAKRQREDLIAQLSTFVITLIAFLICQWNDLTLQVTLTLFSIIGCSVYVYYGLRSYQLASRRVSFQG